MEAFPKLAGGEEVGLDQPAFVYRRMEPVLRRYMRTFRVVALLGARQSGKTTLVQRVVDGGIYLDLDDPAAYAAARDDPVGFVSDRPRPVVIDEVQRGGDDLLRAIKLAVDADPVPGSFVLTGSTNLLTAPSLSESLAGRMGILELHPFSTGETLGTATSGFVRWFVDVASRSRGADNPYSGLLGRPASNASRRSYVQLICRGGYPEVQRLDERDRAVFLRSLLTAIVARDVREISGARRVAELPRLLTAIAARTAGELVIEDLHRGVGFGASQTTADYVTYLEMVYLTATVSPWASSAATRAKRKPKIYLNDTGIATTLLGLGPERLLDPMERTRGPLHETLVANEIRKQLAFLDEGAVLHHFRDRRGREIDLLVVLPDGRMLGIEVTASMRAHGRKADTLRWFRDLVGNRFELGVLFYAGAIPIQLAPRILALPISYLWET